MGNSAKESKLEFLRKLSPNARAGVAVGAVAVVVLVGVAVTSPSSIVSGNSSLSSSQTTMSIPQNKDNSNENIAADQKAAEKIILQQGDSIDKLKQENLRLIELSGKPQPTEIALQNQLDALASEVAKVKQLQADALMHQLPPPIPVSTEPTLNDVPPPIAIVEVSKIRVIGASNVVGGSKVSKAPLKPQAYLPAGTFFEAVLLNGMDAPTNPVAIKNPVPALARIKTDAFLPNLFKHNVKECFVLMAGYGSLASERAVLRLESLSCTAEDGKVIEAKLDGYVVGEDGRVGMRGRLVSKQGQLIAQSLTAGILGGFGTAMTPTATPGLNLNSGTSYSLPSPGSIASSAAGKGFSDAATTVSKFYLDMASQMTPIVEVDAGRKVTLILTKGIEVM